MKDMTDKIRRAIADELSEDTWKTAFERIDMELFGMLEQRMFFALWHKMSDNAAGHHIAL